MKIKFYAETEVPDAVGFAILAIANNATPMFSTYVKVSNGWTYDLDVPFTVEKI